MLHAAFAINQRNPELIPNLVSWLTWSPVYHCELLFSDGNAISAERSGVQWVQRIYDWYNWVTLPMPWIDWLTEKSIKSKAAEILKQHPDGKPEYDYFGAIFGRLETRLEDSTKWYCTELINYLIGDYTPNINMRRWYSPGMLWQTLSDYLWQYKPEYQQSWCFRYSSPKSQKKTSETVKPKSDESEAD